MRQGAPRRGLTSPAQGSLSWPRLYPKHKTETFLKREKSSEDSSGDMSVCASISCMRFLYSIFLAIVVSLFAEGWERPSVSGTHPLSHCHSVPCVPCLRSPTATSMLLWLMGCTRPLGRCPPHCFPTGSPSQQLQPPGRDMCTPVRLPLLIPVSCRAMTWFPVVPPW